MIAEPPLIFKSDARIHLTFQRIGFENALIAVGIREVDP
jgi:hypothetical protein